MNWFKKLFASNEEEYREEIEVEEKSVSTTRSKTPFRFPLISDLEKNETFYEQPNDEKTINESFIEKPARMEETYKPLHTQEIWQQRKQQTVVHRLDKREVDDTPAIIRKKRGFTPTEVPSPVFGFAKSKETSIKAETSNVGEAPIRNIQETWQQRKRQSVKNITSTDIVDPIPTTGRKKGPFVPTEVPSPIYGLSKEREYQKNKENIEKEKKKEQAIIDETPIAPIEEQIIIKEAAVTLLEVEKPTEAVEKPVIVEEAAVLLEEPAMIVEDVAVLLEESAVTSEEVTVEQTTEQKTVEPKENIRPFNVLMLKSDKEKRMEKEPIVEEPIVKEALPISVLEETVTKDDIEIDGATVLEQASEEKLEERKENIRPFNVLMLKSDKDKLNKLSINNIKQPIIPNSVEPVLIPTKSPEPEVEQEYVPSNYTKPSFDYLLPPEMKDEDKEWMEEQAYTLVEALSHFQVAGEIVQMVQGPAVTQFELTVGHGTKVSKIRNLADDLKLALAAKDIRIQAPIPGKRSIGIEIPNRSSRAVRLSEVINTEVFTNSDSPLEAALGLDLTGKPVTLDLCKMPHGLIAGATGSGKSVFINSLLVSLLYKATPEEVKLLLIDPKMVELAPFNHVPHLISPVITDVKAATAALKWAVEEMERRYQLFAHIGVRDISRYNTLATSKRQFAQKLPYIVIVIDELADLMMMAPTEVEDAICRIAQKARACGIHLVLATQRPSVDVITGLIKANIPTRIAFSVSSQIDSRTILDQQGAERLLGRGDMLYQGNGMSSPVRIQGTYVSDDEIEAVIEYARSQGTPEYIFEQEELLQKAETSEQDELFEEACRFIVEQGSASTSLLQRKFHLGYNRAARLIDAMYESGYITEQKGSKARDVLLTNESLDQIFS
ncbi:DNA translocase FtsK [Bacillus sp. FJAT-22090]|uniref:DNA translocase FtsK n=1 Tax=Bacillus sp. FJAT-22090 TaxID=1581038 RepID=UPI0028CB8ED0|nr:DNA translocase FtsK [Bacillus sp. FJAT-22090]